MWRRFTFSALLAILMVQYVVPTTTANDQDPSNNELQHGLTPNAFTIQDNDRKYLTFLAIKNFTVLVDIRLEGSREIVRDVLADPTISGVNTEEMLNERSILEKYLTDAKEVAEAQPPQGNSVKEIFFSSMKIKGRVLKDFDGFVQLRNASTTEISDTQKIVWQTLLRHGLDEYHNKLTSGLESFGTHFADEVLLYVGSLSVDERKKEKVLVELCRQYEQNPDNAGKVKLGLQSAGLFIDEK